MTRWPDISDVYLLPLQACVSELIDQVQALRGCVLPPFGGIYSDKGYTLCLNQTYYDTGFMVQKYMTIMADLKKSCKISAISYGPLHVKEGQKSTRQVWLKVCQ